MITSIATHLLVPRGLAHVSKGGIERFVWETETTFMARLHLRRYRRKQLKPRTRLPDARNKRRNHTYMAYSPDFRFSSHLYV